jgi:uncharacterized protein YggU (UPF0235/DUF167 family)
LGAASLFLGMFIRKNKNRSSVSIQIISGSYKVLKTIGAKTQREEELLELLADRVREDSGAAIFVY